MESGKPEIGVCGLSNVSCDERFRLRKCCRGLTSSRTDPLSDKEGQRIFPWQPRTLCQFGNGLTESRRTETEYGDGNELIHSKLPFRFTH